MKHSILIAGLVAIAACNSAPTPTENQQTAQPELHESPGTHEMPATIDTTAILPGQKVYFKNLKEGQEIKLPYILKFGVEGMEVEPAAGIVANKGHHHLVIDGVPVQANTMVPMGKEAEGYYHFGKGQLQDTLSLSKYPMLTPGEHSITLQFANGMHMSYGPAMSNTVHIKVK